MLKRFLLIAVALSLFLAACGGITTCSCGTGTCFCNEALPAPTEFGIDVNPFVTFESPNSGFSPTTPLPTTEDTAVTPLPTIPGFSAVETPNGIGAEIYLDELQHNNIKVIAQGNVLGAPTVNAVLTHYLEYGQQLNLISSSTGEEFPMNVYDFVNAPEDVQEFIYLDLIEAAEKDSLFTKLEIGRNAGVPLHVIDIASNSTQTLAIGIHWLPNPIDYKFPERIPAVGTNTLAVIIDLNPWVLVENKTIVKAPQAFSIAPDRVEETVVMTSLLGEIGYVIPDPKLLTFGQDLLQENVSDMHPYTVVGIQNMSVDLITALFGTKPRSLLDHKPSDILQVLTGVTIQPE